MLHLVVEGQNHVLLCVSYKSLVGMPLNLDTNAHFDPLIRLWWQRGQGSRPLIHYLLLTEYFILVLQALT